MVLHSLPHIAHTYVHTQSTSLVVFRTSFRFPTVRQLQLETHFIVAILTLLSLLINYRYYKPKPTSTPLSQPNPLFSPIHLTGSPVAPICTTGQSTLHLRRVRRSRDTAYLSICSIDGLRTTPMEELLTWISRIGSRTKSMCSRLIRILKL